MALLPLSLLCAAPGGSRAADETPPQRVVRLALKGQCPNADSVEAELQPLLSRWTLTKAQAGASEVAQVIDRGGSFAITVVGDHREVSDAARNCQERARVAAVIIALRLEPARSEAELDSASQTPPQTAPPSSVDPAPIDPDVAATPDASRGRGELEMGVSVLAEKGLDRALSLGAGPQLSLAASSGIAVFYASGGVQSAARLTAQGIPLSFTRFPLDVGLGLSLVQGDWYLQPLALLALDNFRVSAGGVEEGQVSGRLELGPRVAFRILRRTGRLRPFGLLRVAWFPRNYVIEAEPVGEIGRTPQWWAGISLGFGLPLTRW